MTRRLLFVTSNRIGDAVLTTGLLGHLISEMDGPTVTVACGPVAASLFAGVPNLERLISMRKRPHRAHWAALWSAVVGTRWHTAVDMRGSALTWLLPFVHRRLAVGKAADSVHRVQAAGAVVGRREVPPAPRLWVSPHHTASAAAIIPPECPVLALAPAANWWGKTWRAEHFAALARRVTSPDGILPGAVVAVMAGPGEEEQVTPVLSAVPEGRRVSLIGDNDLLTVAACLQRCTLFVGNDSGLMHIAAAMGTPTVGLFGPSRVDHFGPWGRYTRPVMTTIPYTELVPPGVDLRHTDSLMDSISVDMVEQAVVDLLQEVSHG